MVTAPIPQEPKENDSNVFDGGSRPNFRPLGASGTEVFAGYFSEEYLQQLRGRKGAKIFDEMRRSETQIAMLMNAVMNPIKAGTWEVESPKEIPDGDVHKAFIDFNIKECIDWETHIHEALTMLFHGYSVFEEINAVLFNHPKFGTRNVLKAMAFRSQKTIERWIVERETGKLLKVVQWVQGDLSPSGTMLEMDAQFVRVFTLSKEGDNYEGVSALRPMYGAWFRKNLYLKIAGIGLESSAKGIPMGTIPAGSQKQDEVDKFKEMLSNFVAHESAYLLKPAGWEVEIIKNEFDADKVKEMIVLENTEMINSLVANFLALGTSGGGGSYALGSDLSDFFLTGIQNYANLICGVWNRVIIPRLIKLNYGEQEAYPKLVVSDINDKAGKELSEIVKALVDGKVIKPDDKLEESLRKRYALPPADPTSAREVNPPQPSFGAQFSEDRIQLAESYKKQWNTNKEMVKTEMQDGLRVLLDNYKKQIRYKWPQTSKAQRPLIALELEPKGLPQYKADLKEVLAEVANQALADAKKLTPKAKGVKLSEAIQLAAPRGGYFEALPANIKRIVRTQAELIGESQAADLLKIVAFQFNSSQSSTDDVDQVLLDIEDAAAPTIEGATGKGMSVDAAAGNAVSTVSNQAQLEWFFEPEVLDTIESFTFYNEDPQSEICQELDGTTWAVNDPDLDRYAPPLHHNCKSRIIPNEKGAKGNPEIERTGAISQKALDSMTLCECNYHIEFKLKEYKWAELSPEDQKKVSDKIALLIGEGKDQSQAAAIAYSMLARGEL